MMKGQRVEVTIRSKPQLDSREGTITEVNKRTGEIYVTDGESFGHWYGGESGDTDPEGDSVFFIKVVS